VLKKLKTLNIPPSPQCNDHEFIRRAFLDAAGVLPTPEEIKAFLGDKAPDKRAKLIDKLLDRPEFVDYWAYYWSDVFLVSSRTLPQPAMWSFYQFIRQASRTTNRGTSSLAKSSPPAAATCKMAQPIIS